jgi:Protein of unknown function DUF115
MDLYTFEATFDKEAVANSVRTNLARGLPSVAFGSVAGGTLSICANGPSLRDVYPTEGPIVALNGAWRCLVERGVMPKFILAYDPTPENVAWFKDAPKEPYYLIGSRMVPEVFELLKDHKVHIWNVYDTAEFHAGANDMVYGGPTVGLHALNVMAAIGYDHFELYGYDCCISLKDQADHAAPQPWGPRNPQPFQAGEQLFLAEPWMVGQAQEFFKIVEANRKDYTVDVKSPGLLKALLEFAWLGRSHNNIDLEAAYDLNYAPGSFDFIWSLMNLENFRKAHGYRKTKIHFRAGPDKGFRPNESIDVSHEHKSGMINNVARPLIEMFDCEEVPTPKDDSKPYLSCTYSPMPAIQVYRQFKDLPEFAPNAASKEWAKPYMGCTTITLREAHYWVQRNSNVKEWVKAADYLKNKYGCRVVFLRDTYKAYDPIVGHEICPEAAIDLHKRLALYRVAEMNLFIVNGPAGLAWATRNIPYITMWTKAPGYHCYNDEWLKAYQGFGHGEQYPWRNPDIQAIVWKEDTAENIIDAYLDMPDLSHKTEGARKWLAS